MSNHIFLFAKYLFRTLHVTSFGILFGSVVMDYLFGPRNFTQNENKYKVLYAITGVTLMVSGLINMIILIKENKYVKNFSYSLWKNLLIAKFFFDFIGDSSFR